MVMRRQAPRFWYQRPGFFAWLLSPFSTLYRLLIALKRMCYRCGICRVVSFKTPVIVVGNLTVGGSGKTPLVIALAAELQRRGYRPGIVSRGYGGRAAENKAPPTQVTPESDPAVVGDEPVLLARRTACPVVVAVDRVAAVQVLLASSDVTVVISDDGLQHWRLGRSHTLLLVDAQRGFGNGFCLPAGPLREPVSAAKQADMLIASRGQLAGADATMRIVEQGIYSLREPARSLSVAELVGRPCYAITGIAAPERFFASVAELGVDAEPVAFPDHHGFVASDFPADPQAIFIITEKDAVKCQAFADSRFYVLAITAALDSWEHLVIS